MAKPIKIINVKILNDGEIEMDNLSLGMQYEKNATKLVFEVPEELEKYNKTIEFSTGDDKKFTDVILNNEYLIDNNVSCCLFVSFQVTFTDTEGNEVFKTIVKDQIFDKSINAENPAPTPEEVSQWNTLITTLNEEIETVNNLDISIDTIDENVILTITKKDGSEESTIVSSGGASDYDLLPNKPRINNIELIGDKSLEQLGIQPIGTYIQKEEDPTVPNHVKEISTSDIEQWNNKAEKVDIPTKTSELTNDSNYAKTSQNNNFSTAQTINGDLTVNGNIVQSGEAYETHSEQLYTEKDEIITRDGAIGGLTENQLTGIRAKNYDGANDGQLGFDANGTARVGDVGDTQPLLTRDEAENLTNGQVLVWDGTNVKAVGSSDYIKNTDVASETKAGIVKMWTSVNEDGETGLNISTEV